MISNEQIILWPYLIFGIIDEMGEKNFCVLERDFAVMKNRLRKKNVEQIESRIQYMRLTESKEQGI